MAVVVKCVLQTAQVIPVSRSLVVRWGSQCLGCHGAQQVELPFTVENGCTVESIVVGILAFNKVEQGGLSAAIVK